MNGVAGCVVAFVAAASLLFALTAAPAAERVIAVTIDDLPGPLPGIVSNTPADVLALNRKLVAALRAERIPAVGFVNEGKLFVQGERAEQAALRIAALEAWLDAGLELGNHSYSHRDFNSAELEAFQADVLQGEQVTRKLSAARKSPYRYFRHPYLHVGLELDKRRALETFLAANHYSVAPVTVDNDEYMYAAVYADAVRRSDQQVTHQVADDYLRYMNEITEFYEGVSRALFGREIRQVLLIHANALNTDHFPRLAQMFRARLQVHYVASGAQGSGVRPRRYLRWRVGNFVAHALGSERGPQADPSARSAGLAHGTIQSSEPAPAVI